MSRKGFFKVKVVSCCDSDFWYANKVGDHIFVKRTEWDGWGFEHTSGFSVFRHDVEIVSK